LLQLEFDKVTNDLFNIFFFLFLDRISPVFGCRCHRSTIRARRTGHSRSRTPSGFRCTLVDRHPIAPVARGHPRGCRTRRRRSSGCRPPGGVRSSGCHPPCIARPHSRALLMFYFG